MRRHDADARPLRIACPNFSAEEVGALRSILGLLKPYLRQPWIVDAGGTPDLCLLNLDQPGAPAIMPHGAPGVVGCSQRPRSHPRGTLHRPLRPSELLAVLSDTGARMRGGEEEASASSSLEWSFQLLAWPVDLFDWPRSWWRVMACISREPVSMKRIAERTELPVRYVEACLEGLAAANLVQRVPRIREKAAPPPAGRWSALAGRILQRFRLGR